MGLDDKFENKAQDLAGRGKEAAGAVTGDDQLKAEGKGDQAKASLKDKVEHVKDKVAEKVDDAL
jgi:uncharacterized protein YjbJ (UPF0337 family)